MEENDNNKLNINLPEDVAEGTYSNMAIISHSMSEFIIDFIRLMPGVPKANVKSRVVMTPENAKRLLLALKDNIDKYEADRGHIQLGGTPKMPTGFNVPPKGDA